MFDALFMILWIIVTIVIFSYLKSRTSVISFNGTTGFLEAYLGLLIESGIFAGIIVAVPLYLLKSIGMYVIGAAIVIGGFIAVTKKGGSKKDSTLEVIHDSKKTVDNVSGGEKRFCENCGAKIEDKDKVCKKCGSSLE